MGTKKDKNNQLRCHPEVSDHDNQGDTISAKPKQESFVPL